MTLYQLGYDSDASKITILHYPFYEGNMMP